MPERQSQCIRQHAGTVRRAQVPGVKLQFRALLPSGVWVHGLWVDRLDHHWIVGLSCASLTGQQAVISGV